MLKTKPPFPPHHEPSDKVQIPCLCRCDTCRTLSPGFPAFSYIWSHAVNSFKLRWNRTSLPTQSPSAGTQNLSRLGWLLWCDDSYAVTGELSAQNSLSIRYGCSPKVFLEKKISTTPARDSGSSRVNIRTIFKMQLVDLSRHFDGRVASTSKIKICVT